MASMLVLLSVAVIAQTGREVFDRVHTSIISVDVEFLRGTGKRGTGYIVCTNTDIRCVKNASWEDGDTCRRSIDAHGTQETLADSWRAWLQQPQNYHRELPLKSMLALTAAHVLTAPGDDGWPNKVYVSVYTDERDEEGAYIKTKCEAHAIGIDYPSDSAVLFVPCTDEFEAGQKKNKDTIGSADATLCPCREGLHFRSADDRISTGEEIYTIGDASARLKHSFIAGHVSLPDVNKQFGSFFGRKHALHMQGNRGDSGGAVLDRDGHVVGLWSHLEGDLGFASTGVALKNATIRLLRERTPEFVCCTAHESVFLGRQYWPDPYGRSLISMMSLARNSKSAYLAVASGGLGGGSHGFTFQHLWTEPLRMAKTVEEIADCKKITFSGNLPAGCSDNQCGNLTLRDGETNQRRWAVYKRREHDMGGALVGQEPIVNDLIRELEITMAGKTDLIHELETTVQLKTEQITSQWDSMERKLKETKHFHGLMGVCGGLLVATILTKIVKIIDTMQTTDPTTNNDNRRSRKDMPGGASERTTDTTNDAVTVTQTVSKHAKQSQTDGAGEDKRVGATGHSNADDVAGTPQTTTAVEFEAKKETDDSGNVNTVHADDIHKVSTTMQATDPTTNNDNKRSHKDMPGGASDNTTDAANDVVAVTQAVTTTDENNNKKH